MKQVLSAIKLTLYETIRKLLHASKNSVLENSEIANNKLSNS